MKNKIKEFFAKKYTAYSAIVGILIFLLAAQLIADEYIASLIRIFGLIIFVGILLEIIFFDAETGIKGFLFRSGEIILRLNRRAIPFYTFVFYLFISASIFEVWAIEEFLFNGIFTSPFYLLAVLLFYFVLLIGYFLQFKNMADVRKLDFVYRFFNWFLIASAIGVFFYQTFYAIFQVDVFKDLGMEFNLLNEFSYHSTKIFHLSYITDNEYGLLYDIKLIAPYFIVYLVSAAILYLGLKINFPKKLLDIKDTICEKCLMPYVAFTENYKCPNCSEPNKKSNDLIPEIVRSMIYNKEKYGSYGYEDYYYGSPAEETLLILYSIFDNIEESNRKNDDKIIESYLDKINYYNLLYIKKHFYDLTQAVYKELYMVNNNKTLNSEVLTS